MRRSLLLVPVALFTLLGAPAPKTTSAPGLDGQRLALIAPRLEELVQRGEISGAVALVARHGTVASTAAVGFADKEANRPMRPDTIFQIMSMTKPFVGAGIMMLADDGKLGLLDPAEKYIPEFRDAKLSSGEKARPITIRDLMTHTSGMSYLPPAPIKELNQKMDLPLADAVREFGKMPLEYAPGSKWQYSNLGIATLGRIIEVVSKQPFEQFMAERLFRPLGMKDTFFFAPPDKVDRIAMVYKYDQGKLARAGASILGGDPALHRPNAKYPAPEWGLYSTAPDLLRFYQMLLNEGMLGGRRYLSRSAVHVMTTVQTGPIKAGFMNGGSGYGLTVEVVNDPMGELLFLPPGTFGHGGAFGTQGWIDPKDDLIRILLIQREGGDNDVRNAFFAITQSAVVD